MTVDPVAACGSPPVHRAGRHRRAPGAAHVREHGRVPAAWAASRLRRGPQPDRRPRGPRRDHLRSAPGQHATRAAGHGLGAGPVVEQKHLQFFAFPNETAGLLDALGLSGRYPAVEGDFVGVTHSNAAGNKIDLFLERSLDYEVVWEPSTGALSATATITLTNGAPASGLPGLRDRQLPRPTDRRQGTPHGMEQPVPHPLHAMGRRVGDPRRGTDQLGPLRRARTPGALHLRTRRARGHPSSPIELTGFLAGPQYALDLAAQPLVTAEAVTVSVRVAGASGLRRLDRSRWQEDRVAGSFSLLEDLRIATVRR